MVHEDPLRTIPLELYADLVCPWCWIGDRRLMDALARVREAHPEVHFDLMWRPFQLDPTIPAEGHDWADFVERKFGGMLRAQPMFDRVAEAGAGDGLTFDFGRMTRSPNTVRGHALVVHAQQTGLDPWPLVERLFAAHFTHGEDIGDLEVLVGHAVAGGMAEADARATLEGGRYDVDVQQSQREAARLGITGVPFLVLDGRYGVSGAQPTEVFAQALMRAVSE